MDNRVLELEKRCAYQEKLLDDLNDVVFKQQKQIDQLLVDIRDIKEQLARKSSELENPSNEKPPHY